MASSALVKTASSGEMLSSGSDDGRFVSGDDGAVGMAHQVDVQVEGASVAVGSHWGSVGNGGNSSVGNTVCGSESIEVFSTGCGHCRLVHWNHCTVGVTHLSRDVLMAIVVVILLMVLVVLSAKQV